MSFRKFGLILFFLFISFGAVRGADDFYFGVRVHDPFRWLENKKDPKVQEWVRTQSETARRYLDALPERNGLLSRYQSLFKVDHVSVPVAAGGKLFYEKHRKDEEKPMVEWRETPASAERPLLDINEMSRSRNVSLDAWEPSWDGTQLLYITAENNADEAVLHVLNVQTGQEDPHDTIPGANYADPSWDANDRGFYYTRLPMDPSLTDAQRVARADVHFHTLGEDPAQDPLVYPKTGNPQIFLSPTASEDGRWLFITVQRGWSSSEIYAKPELEAPQAFKPIFVSTCSTAAVSEWGDHFYLFTNLNAPHYRVAEAVGPVLKDIVPERSDTVIRSMVIVNKRLVLSVLKNAAMGIEIYSLNGRLERRISLPALGTVSDLRERAGENPLYFRYESFFVAPRVYEASVDSSEPKIWAEEKIPVGASSYDIQQVWYPSKDGTSISMFIVRRRGSPVDGRQPLLLHGYGGFNEAELPRFNPMIYPWLEAGGAVAAPNLRGGGEYGEAWHRAGMLTHKQNTFDDFISAARFLTRQGYTDSQHLVIDGASNGGLLVAAAVTQHPELFRAAVCKVPLTDMIRYPLFGEGSSWIPEYGSPRKVDEFRALWAYSPYHHVKPARYPAVLLISADSDDRVDPMHARKMAAALEAVNQGTFPILLLTQANAGHTGADRTQSWIEEAADRTAFLMQQVGLTAQ